MSTNVAKKQEANTIPSHREQLIQLFQQHNPEKLGDVDMLLEKYKGREDIIFKKIEDKYGAKPETGTAVPLSFVKTAADGLAEVSVAAQPPVAMASFPPMSVKAPTNPFAPKLLSSITETPVEALDSTSAFINTFSTSLIRSGLVKTPELEKIAKPAFGDAGVTFGSGSGKLSFGSTGGGFVFGSSSPTQKWSGFAPITPPLPRTDFGSSVASSPFDAFTKQSSSAGVLSPIKRPLFVTKTQDIPDTRNAKPGAEVAAKTFDEFDKLKTGSIPMEKFESMIDVLGEGFSAGELVSQMQVIDPENTGTVSRSAFIEWYVHLVDDHDDDDGASLDSEEKAEREDEEARVKKCFMAVGGGTTAIAAKDFGKLFKSMGSTYCEEEHRKTLANLTGSDGKIQWEVFCDWYMGWLFRGDEEYDSEDDGDVTKSDDCQDDGMTPVARIQGWGNLFGPKKNTWKCDSCFVANDDISTVCAACETPRPGTVAPAAIPPSGTLGSSELGVIGCGGFKFGISAPVPTSGIDSGGVLFGVTPSTTITSAPSGSGIISDADYSNPSLSTAGAQSNAGIQLVAIGSGGHRLGSSASALVSGIASSGSLFDVSPSTTTIMTPSNKGVHLAIPQKDAPLTSLNESSLEIFSPSGLVSGTLGVGEKHKNIKLGAEVAAKTFDEFDKLKTGSIPMEKFESMIDVLGEGFSAGELVSQMQVIDPENTGTVSRSAFIEWYVHLVDDHDDDDGASLDSEEKAEREDEEARVKKCFMAVGGGTTAIAAKDFGKLFKSMGSTYCEEEHRKTLANLTGSDGKIQWEVFCDWYMGWLFRGDEEYDSEDDGDVTKSDDCQDDGMTPVARIQGWGNLFGPKKNTWKCDSCFVANDDISTVCAACETPRPGTVAPAAIPPSGTLGSSELGVIGCGGFKFGISAPVPTSGIDSGGVLFGVTPSTTITSAPSGSGIISDAPANNTVLIPLTKPSSIVSSTTSPMLSRTNMESKESVTESNVTGSESYSFGNANVPASSSLNPNRLFMKKVTPSTVRPTRPALGGFSTGIAQTMGPPMPSSTYLSSGVLSPSAPIAKLSSKEPANNMMVSTSAGGYPPILSKAPTNPLSLSSTTFPLSNAHRERLLILFQEHNPGKVKDVDILLEKYKGREDDLIKKVERTYAKPNKATSSVSVQGNIVSESENMARLKFQTSSVLQPGQHSSDYESQFIHMIEDFKATILMLDEQRFVELELEAKVEQFTAAKDKIYTVLVESGEEIIRSKDQAMFLLSRNSDTQRLVNEARQFIQQQSLNDEILRSLPLNAESETFRRRLAVKAIMATKLKRLLENNLEMMNSSCHRVNEAINGPNGKHAIFGALKSLFDDATIFETSSIRMVDRASEKERSIPVIVGSNLVSKTLLQSTGKSGRVRIEALPIDGGDVHPRESGTVLVTATNKWKGLESRFQSFKPKNVNTTKISITSRLERPASRKETNRVHSQPLSTSRFLSPSRGDERSSFNKAAEPRTLFFGSPSIVTRNVDWEKPFRVDQVKVQSMVFAASKQIKEIDASDAAQEALIGYGTTLAKVNKVMDTKRRGEESPNIQQLHGLKSASNSLSTSSSAAFPTPSTKDPVPLSSAGPMPAITVFDSKPSAYTRLSKEAPTPSALRSDKIGGSTKPPLHGPVAPIGKIDATSFSLTGVGDSLLPEKIITEPGKLGNLGAIGSGVGSSLDSPSAPANVSLDFHYILTKFYEKHNPAKLSEVRKTLENYKGREVEMFTKLGKKYGVPSPLSSSPSNAKPVDGQDRNPVLSPFSSPLPANSFVSQPQALSSFVSFSTSSSTPAGDDGMSTDDQVASFGASEPGPSPFGAPSAMSGGFGAPSAFASTSAPSNSFSSKSITPSPFGLSAGGFGTMSASTTTSFGTAPTSAAPAFGAATTAPSPFAAVQTQQHDFNGKNPRELLTAFYQQQNPQKLGEIDKVLQKYQGNEDQLFRNLAKKYNLDPSVFGLSTAAAGFGGSSPGFGQPSSLGGSTMFGSGGNVTSTGSSAFGSSSTGSGFGQPSTLGGGIPSSGFGSTTVGVFSATNTSSFGSLAQSPAPFGGATQQAQSGGFGSTFGGNAHNPVGGFGAQSSPFGGPRR